MTEQVIWKYELSITDDIEVEMPAYSEVLYFAMQDNTPCIWVIVEPESKPIIKKFKLFGTGYDIYDAHKLRYIGTVLLFNGAQVYHLFEVFQE